MVNNSYIGPEKIDQDLSVLGHLTLTLFKRGDVSSVTQKCFNKVIFSKLIFSVKVLMLCSSENVACFLRLLIILNVLSVLKVTYIRLYRSLVLTRSTVMMEVNILHPDQTETHATYTFFVQDSILCNQGHIVTLQCTLFTS